MKYGDLDNEISGRGEEGGFRGEILFLRECDKFPACVTISHNQINSMDPYLPAGQKKRQRRQSRAPLTTITPVCCDSSVNSSKFPPKSTPTLIENCFLVIHYIQTTLMSVINSATAPPSLISCCRNNTAAHRSQRTPHPCPDAICLSGRSRI